MVSWPLFVCFFLKKFSSLSIFILEATLTNTCPVDSILVCCHWCWKLIGLNLEGTCADLENSLNLLENECYFEAKLAIVPVTNQRGQVNINLWGSIEQYLATYSSTPALGTKHYIQMSCQTCHFSTKEWKIFAEMELNQAK